MNHVSKTDIEAQPGAVTPIAGQAELAAAEGGRAEPAIGRDGLCNTATWDALAEMAFAAESVDVIGIAPRELVEALRARGENALPGSLPPLRYFTPAPELILASHEQGIRTRLVNRWDVGLKGLRNLVRGLEDPDTVRTTPDSHRFISSLSSFFTDCVVLLGRAHREPDVIYLSELPTVAGVTGATPTLFFRLRDTTAELVSYMRELMDRAGILRQREVSCLPLAASRASSLAADTSALPELSIRALVPYGSKPADEPSLKPVAVVAVRCYSPNGMEVLLKIRSPLTDNDDFGKLSLLSSRVQESDVAAALNTNVSPAAEDDQVALEDLWLAAGSPARLTVPTAAYVQAAHRELFMTCGIEVAPERLVMRGFRWVEHEEFSTQLGFAVFTVDLVRGPQFDEVRHALQRNPDSLIRVPVSDLYSGNHQLNRLLRVQREWLTQYCFSPIFPNS